MDVQGNGSKAGTKVIARKHQGGKSQQWKMTGDKIISLQNGMCLDVDNSAPGGSKSSNVEIILHPLKSADLVDNQSWELVYE